jgi:hypothetical protein
MWGGHTVLTPQQHAAIAKWSSMIEFDGRRKAGLRGLPAIQARNGYLFRSTQES